MTPHEIIQEIKHFSVDEKALIIEQISHSLRSDLQANNEKAQIENNREQLTVAEKMAIVESLHGIGAVEGKPAPTDEEIREDYTNYLMEKYS